VTREAAAHGECDARFHKVREVFERNLNRGEVGAAIAVTLNGEPVIDLWGGYADRERTRPWERDTLVNVYSTTKGMTALCALRLADSGKLDLDAPVVDYWPEFAQGGKQELPVRYLLTHQAGLPALHKELPGDALYHWDLMTEALAEQEPWWPPGTRHGYHALTFGYLVGELVRRIDGRSIGCYFREELAEPLGLDFHIGLEEAQHARCAEMIPARPAAPGTPDLMKEFLKSASSVTAKAFTNPSIPDGAANSAAWRRAEIPAANGHGTARALASVYGALAVGGKLDGFQVLSSAAIEQASREQAFGPDEVLLKMPMRFGLGFFLTQKLIPLGPNPRSFGHPGAGGSIAFADPDARLGFAYVMNQMQQGLTGDARGFGLIHALYEAF
jgi:CubicO group peptidase (beta-lactamase class C family)